VVEDNAAWTNGAYEQSAPVMGAVAEGVVGDANGDINANSGVSGMNGAKSGSYNGQVWALVACALTY
jgi:hypothetical protein